MIVDPDTDLIEMVFTLPADAKLVPLDELSPRIRAMLGSIDGSENQIAVSRPGFRATTRLITSQFADLLSEFRQPSRLTDAVLRFSRARERDPFETLDAAFEGLSSFIDSRVLVPSDSASADAVVPSLAAGQAFAAYEVARLVSSLEDTEVYLALTAEQRPLALKIARSGVPDAVVTGLAREADILRHLGGGITPAIVEHSEYRGRAFIAMEWRPGTPVTVAAQQARAGADRRSLHRLCLSLLTAYHALHRQGVVHGDIHPGNILVDDEGNVTILDMGRSRLVEEERASEAVEADPARAGVPYFYEPEIAKALLAGAAPPPATVRAEQYSLAAIIYYLITGHHHVDFAPEYGALLAQIVERPPLPFTARGLQSWPEIETVLATALAKNPAERFGCVAQLLDAFEQAGLAECTVATSHHRERAATRLLEASLRIANGRSCSNGDGMATPATAIDLAYFSLRAALVRDDPILLAKADVWAGRGRTHGGTDWRTEAIAAEVHHARGDPASEESSISSFLSACGWIGDQLDVLGGRCGALVSAARLLEGAAASEIDCSSLALWARQSLAGMWRTIDRWPALAECRQLPHLGMAHGWAGLLYATLRTCRAAALPRPPGLAERLDQLADLAQPSGRGLRWYGTMPHIGLDAHTPSLAPGWCSGSAGHVELWTLAHEETGDARYLALAERAGCYAVDHPADNPDYCCGTTGRAFALLRLYQVTGNRNWLAHAQRLADSAAARWDHRPGSIALLKGSLGTALLLLELERPERAVQPISGPLRPGIFAKG
jgi:eukaryotic-like serine/threonine-protein kinase